MVEGGLGEGGKWEVVVDLLIGMEKNRNKETLWEKKERVREWEYYKLERHGSFYKYSKIISYTVVTILQKDRSNAWIFLTLE